MGYNTVNLTQNAPPVNGRKEDAVERYQEIKDQICDVCHKTWQLGWVAANDGNVSARLPDGSIIATPTGISKSFITPEKLVLLDSAGNILEANEGYRPSSEIKMHLRCYEKRPDLLKALSEMGHGDELVIAGRGWCSENRAGV